MKSIWKLKPVELPFFRKRFTRRLAASTGNLKLWTKGTRIFSDLLEKTLQLYNGGKFVELSVKKEMLNFFLGSFVLTKRITSVIHSKTRKNKKGRRKKKK
jgi:ribosomal protein S19